MFKRYRHIHLTQFTFTFSHLHLFTLTHLHFLKQACQGCRTFYYAVIKCKLLIVLVVIHFHEHLSAAVIHLKVAEIREIE